MKKILLGSLLGCTAMVLASAPASATLTTFYQTSGTVALSSDGCGTTASSCPLVVNVPTGSTVIAAYLYTGTSLFAPPSGDTGTLTSGTTTSSPFTYTNLLQNPSSSVGLQAGRVDVTSFVQGIVGGGSSSPINFSVSESNSATQDGEALYVIYSNPALPTQSVALVDGAATTSGDATSINFTQPIDPTAPGFVANMRVADSFSFDENGFTVQESTVTVDGHVLSNNVGNCDDGLKVDSACANGNLITVGGDNDPAQGPDTAAAGTEPDLENTHENFNIASLLSVGDTSINITTFNASNDDNIFALAFTVTGIAGFNTNPTGPNGPVPEPMTIALFGAGLAGLVAANRRRKPKA